MIRKNWRGWVGLLVVALLPSVAGAYDDGDWQFWNTDAIEYGLNNQWKAQAETEFYFGDDMNEFYYEHVDVSLAGKLAKWFELGANFRFLREKKSEEWRQEYRPHLNGTFLWTLGPVALSDRSRLEYRMRESADDFFRYRNRFRVSSAAKWTRFQLRPYADGELFHDFDASEWNQTRASVGLSTTLLSHLKMDVYYMLQRSKSGDDWKETNVLGVSVKVPF